MANKTFQTDFIIKQKEVTPKHYQEMLGVLPPERMAGNAFLVGEPMDHGTNGRPRFELYFQEDDKFYYGGLATTKDFDFWLIPTGEKRICKRCGDVLSFNDDLICGYHQLQAD